MALFPSTFALTLEVHLQGRDAQVLDVRYVVQQHGWDTSMVARGYFLVQMAYVSRQV